MPHGNTQLQTEIEAHIVITEQINNSALSSNDDKRLQTFDRITSYSYSVNAGKAAELQFPEKMLEFVNIK